jgi:hypothetical protein
MKISPNYDMAIEGQHSAGGVAVEVPDLIGKNLIAQGLAKTAPEAVETAAATAPAETASARGGKKTAAAKASAA